MKLNALLQLITAAVALVLLGLSGCASPAPADSPQAPAFTLPAADGRIVELADYVGQRPALLYFHMAVG
ncbi:MAG: hypothetical protein DCC55_19485 [Chloroflexi bacterium]|nr:MAG: hypothetical protein DCC55_19485 [Chloroflexota bacterium]